MTLRPLVALVVKDLRVFFSDRHAVILSFVAPIALASFMALIFGGAGASTPSKIAVVIVDEDQSPISSKILAGAESETRFATRVDARDLGLAAVRRGEAVVAVVIPEGFGDASADALTGDAKPPDLTFYHDPTHAAELALAQGVFTRLILEAVAGDSFSGLDLDGPLLDSDPASAPPEPAEVDLSVDQAEFLSLFPGLDRDDPADPTLKEDRQEFARSFPGLGHLVKSEPLAPEPEKPGLTMPYVSKDVSITSGGADGERTALAAHAFAAMVVQFALFSAVEWGVGLLIERQRGLWKRLRVAPVSRSTLMLGKLLSSWLVSLAIIAVVFTFGAIVFKIRVRGDALGFLLMSVTFAWTASNFGLMVASLGRSPQGARAVSLLAVLVLVMLGGGWIPSFLFPQWLQALTPAIPTRWAIDGFDGVLSRGFTLAEASPMLLALSLFGAGFGAVALSAFRWSEPA